MAYMDAGCALKGDSFWLGAIPYTVTGVSDTFDHAKMGCRAVTLTLEYNGETTHKDFDCMFRVELCGISPQLTKALKGQL